MDDFGEQVCASKRELKRGSTPVASLISSASGELMKFHQLLVPLF
jgi:hypothetical protein